MKTLLTFAGLRDPYYHDLFEDGEHRGPILSVLAEKSFDRVVIFSRPYRAQSAEKTAVAIRSTHPRTRVELVEIDIRDATFYPEILGKIRPALHRLQRTTEEEFFISPSSGTPEIQACWVLLVASGEFTARIVNFKRTAQGGLARKPIVREVELKEAVPAIGPEMLARLSSRSGSDGKKEDILRRAGIIGRHPALQRTLETAILISQYEGPVLIEGEPGTGKKLFADLVHRLGARAEQPCVVVNCAALPTEIAVGVLFGEITPQEQILPGKLQAASGGTLVLEDVHDLPRDAQTRLHNFISEGTFFPPGANTSLRLNVRIVATSSRKLADDASSGRFREDLALKFSGERLAVPALRERRSDIALIAQDELQRLNETMPRPKKLSAAALARLEGHSWPGNVTELKHVLRQVVLAASQTLIEAEDLDLEQGIDLSHDTPLAPVKLFQGFSLTAHLAHVRKAIIEAALRKTNGNRTRAARLLGLTPQAVSNYVKETEQ